MSLPWLTTADGASPWPQAHAVIAGVGVSGFAAADGLLQLGARVSVLDDVASEANTDKGTLLEVLGATVRLGPGSTATLLVTVNGAVETATVAEYLHIAHIDGVSELAIFCAAMVGAGIGFLWYNTYPAQVFMGDIGALSLGGAIGMMAVLTKNELVLPLVGGLFVIETLSVIIQVGSFKTRGKRVFKMAPIHHHFEQLGWSEPTVVIRFWIIALVLALVGLSTLKLR